MSLSKGFRLKNKTEPLDFRLAQAASLTRTSGGIPRAGVLYSPSADGSVASRSGSALRLTVLDQVVLALARSGTDGVDIVTNVGAVNLDFSAPTANAQYFTVWARQNDSTMADPDEQTVLSFTAGAAQASPPIPAAPTGATKIGHLLIPAGAASLQATGVVWTETILGTAPIGAAIRYRSTSEQNADRLNLPDGSLGYVRSGDVSFLKGGTWRPIAQATDTGWLTIPPTRGGVTLDATEPARVRYKNGQVTLLGQFNYSGSPGSGIFGYLPDGIPLPPSRVIVPCYNTNRVIIDPADRSVQINLAVASASYARLDGLTWPGDL